MILGVVGHEQEKFTPDVEMRARAIIRAEIAIRNPTRIVSGGCHLGGVDVWAEEIANELGVPMTVYAPTKLAWSGKGGFKERNLRIANDADLVLCVVVKELPLNYRGMRFAGCYHCAGFGIPFHVKSGGCWTAWRAKEGVWRIVE